MLKRIDELLTMYEEKHISRRQLLGALLVASTTPPLAAHASQQPPPPPSPDLTGTPPPKDALFRGRMINHVTMMVNDIEESRRFYQELLGASVLVDGRTSLQEGMFDLRIGDSFVTTVKGKSPVIDHFAVGLDPWPGVDRALEMVQKRFPKSAAQPGQNMRSKAAETRSVTLRDPSGIRVQLGSTKYQL